MPLRTNRRLIPLLLLPWLAALGGCDLVTAEFNHQERAEWRKSYELQPGGRVEVENVNGRIVVEPGAGNTVEVLAEKTVRAAGPDAAREALERLEIVETVSPESIRIETRHPRGGFLGGSNAQVRYTIRVPPGANTSFTTVNGGIELRGLDGPVRARTTNGGVTAREIGGAVEAASTNGGVDVDVTRIVDGGVRLRTTNGGVRLRVPADARATIAARVTNGGIDTGGLPIDATESTRRRLDGHLNGGGPSVTLEGTNGGIRITPR